MNLSLLSEASVAIQLHLVFAIAASILGAFVLFKKKGTPTHRMAGRVWVLIMAVVVLSSFFIAEIRLWGRFSPIHILSVLTATGLVGGVYYARLGQIRRHVSIMLQMYLLGLGIAGSFAFMPGRLLNDMLFGGESWEGFGLVIAIVLIAILWTLRGGEIAHWQSYRRSSFSISR